MLVAAVLRARELLPDPRLRPTLDRAYSAARSLARLLRGVPTPVWGGLGGEGGWGVPGGVPALVWGAEGGE